MRFIGIEYPYLLRSVFLCKTLVTASYFKSNMAIIPYTILTHLSSLFVTLSCVPCAIYITMISLCMLIKI